MPEFSWSTRVQAPVDTVARFHARPGLIRQLTPPATPVTLRRVEPLVERSVAEFTIWLGFLPIRWTALHVDVNPGTGFTDVQLMGPFLTWRHEHRYEEHPDGGTLIVDRIKYRHQKGWRGLLTRLLFSRPMLSLLFAYRSFVYKRSLNSRPASPRSIPGTQG